MAYKTELLPNSVPASADYPFGSGKNESVPGTSNDGTPLRASTFNDQQALFQGLLSRESITPSGTPDTVPVSQYRDGLGRLIARGGDVVDKAAGETAEIGKINRPLNGSGAITVLLPTTGLYAYATVLFSDEPPAAYALNPVTWDAGGEFIGATAHTVDLSTDNILGGYRRNAANTFWVPIKERLKGSV